MTDYPRCATCKWWEARWHECLLLSDTPLVEAAIKMDPALVRDKATVKRLASSNGIGQGSEGSSFETEPDFGCVHHETLGSNE